MLSDLRAMILWVAISVLSMSLCMSQDVSGSGDVHITDRSIPSQRLVIPPWIKLDRDLSELLAGTVSPRAEIDLETLRDTRRIYVKVEGDQRWSLLLQDVEGRVVLRSDAQDVLLKADLQGSTMLGDYGKGSYTIEFYGDVDFSQLQFRWYRWHEVAVRTGFGSSLPCHINSVCDPDKFAQRASVCKISMTMEEGIVSCSGSLIRSLDADPLYVLSAFHCADGLTPIYENWSFEWYYASETCEDVTEEPVSLRLIGCTPVSGNQDSDHLLVRLTDDLPAGDSVFLSGWDRSCNVFPEDSYMVHHPAGDIQKISYARDSTRLETSPINWENDVTSPPRSHIRVRLHRGTQEPGSSGSPLYSPSGKIIGQLHGGNSECQFFTTGATYGRLCYGWEDGGQDSMRLADWLDPQGTDTLRIQGLWRVSSTPASSRLAGRVVDRIDRPVALVQVRAINTETSDTLLAITDNKGEWEITEGTLVGSDYDIHLSKDTNPKNGISARDIVAIQKHLLRRDTFTDPRLLDAAETNSVNTGVTVSDMVIIRKLLLSAITDFRPELDSWILYPPQMHVTELPSTGVFLPATAIKRGDVNDTADPER